MPFETLLYRVRDGVVYVTLNRPERLNALDGPLVDELHAAATAIAADASIRAVLLTGAGRAFCSGADLNGDLFRGSHHGAAARPPDAGASRAPGAIVEPGAGPDTAAHAGIDASAATETTSAAAAGASAAVGASLRRHFNPMIAAWYALAVPVVVAVNGVAAGAGVSLALVGDLVIAARSATFLQLFAPKLGLMPDLGATFHLPRLVGSVRAKGLALLGDPLRAEQAAAWGLIWGCVDDTALDAEAETLARRLAAGPTRAYQRIKATFNAEPSHTLEQQLELEATAQSELAATTDFAEGLAAFHAKRPPRFTGR